MVRLFIALSTLVPVQALSVQSPHDKQYVKTMKKDFEVNKKKFAKKDKVDDKDTKWMFNVHNKINTFKETEYERHYQNADIGNVLAKAYVLDKSGVASDMGWPLKPNKMSAAKIYLKSSQYLAYICLKNHQKKEKPRGKAALFMNKVNLLDFRKCPTANTNIQTLQDWVEKVKESYIHDIVKSMEKLSEMPDFDDLKMKLMNQLPKSNQEITRKTITTNKVLKYI